MRGGEYICTYTKLSVKYLGVSTRGFNTENDSQPSHSTGHLELVSSSHSFRYTLVIDKLYPDQQYISSSQ